MGFTLNQHEQEKQIKKLQKKKDQDTTNYNDLSNLPQINGVELKGDKSLSDLGIQAELTIDDTPTDGSNNPVKSDGVYDSEKDIYAVIGQMGAKNLIPFPYFEASGKNSRGVVFTYGSDGIVYMNGTSEQSSQPFILLQSPLNQNPAIISEDQSYILYCDSDSPYVLGQIFFYRKNDGSPVNLTFSYEYSDGITGEATQSYISLKHHDAICKWVKFTVTSGNASAPQIDMRVDQGSHQVNNAYGKVMLIDGRDTDLTWYLYAKTNKQLTDDITGITPHILPDAPTTDGSYNLKVTVTSGEAAYSWEAVTP